MVDKNMQIYDISLKISKDMPVWPGDPAPFLERFAVLGKESDANISRIEMSLHTGTHIDAPEHFLAEGKTVDQIPLKDLIGRVYLLHLPDVNSINAKILEQSEIPPRTRRILFKTRNSKLWMRGEKSFQSDFVAITSDGAQYLVDRGVKLVGVDYLSVAPYVDTTTTHQILLAHGVVVVEGLDLSGVSQGRYTMYCLPLKVVGVEGAPARTILVGV